VAPERGNEVADAGKPDLVRDRGDGGVAARQEPLGALEPGTAQVAVWGQAGDRAKHAGEVEQAGVAKRGQRRQVEVLAEVGVDVAPDGLDRLALPRPHDRRSRSWMASGTVKPHQQVDDQAVEPQLAAGQERVRLGCEPACGELDLRGEREGRQVGKRPLGEHRAERVGVRVEDRAERPELQPHREVPVGRHGTAVVAAERLAGVPEHDHARSGVDPAAAAADPPAATSAEDQLVAVEPLLGGVPERAGVVAEAVHRRDRPAGEMDELTNPPNRLAACSIRRQHPPTVPQAADNVAQGLASPSLETGG